MESERLPAYTALVPMLPVTDVTRTIAFYERLGFRVGNTHTPDGQDVPVWAWLHSDSAHLMINRAESAIEGTHHSAALWVYSQDVRATHETLAARGVDVGDIEYPPYNTGGEFHVHDPDGYAVFIAQSE